MSITNTAAFVAAIGLQGSAKGQSVAKNAELYAIVAEMNAFKGALRHYVIKNTINNTRDADQAARKHTLI